APLRAREVLEAGARRENHGVQAFAAQEGLRACDAGAVLVQADGRDAVQQGAQGVDGRGYFAGRGGRLGAGQARRERAGRGRDRETEELAAGERHGGYGTLVRSLVAAPAGCSSQPPFSWPAPRRRARPPSLPSCGSAASRPIASPCTSTRGWRRWRGGRPASPPRSWRVTRPGTACTSVA